MVKAMDKPAIEVTPKIEDKEQLLIDAIVKGDLEQTIQIFSEGAIKPDAILKSRGTALMFAAYHGHEHIVRYLVKEKRANANVNVCDKDGLTPLMLAACEGHLNVVACLINEARAAISAVTSDGYTAFYRAAKNGQLSVVQYFAERPDFNPHVDGVVAMSLAQAEKHLDVVQYLITRGVPALPKPGDIAGMHSIFYDDKANEHIKLDSLELLAYDNMPIADSEGIPSMPQGGTLHIYQPRVFRQTAPNEPCIKEQLKMAVEKLGGTADMHCNTSPIYGGTCAYHATKNALVSLMMLHDYDKLIASTKQADDEGCKKSAQWFSADLENLKALRTRDFDCEHFMEQLHAKTFMIQHDEPWAAKLEPVNIQQSFDGERMLVARHEVADAFASIMVQRYHGSRDIYDNMVSFVDYDIFPNYRSPFSDSKEDTMETVYESKNLQMALKHLRTVDLLKQIALFRTNDRYRHAFVLSLDEDNLDGWGQSLDRMHAITVILDKRGSVVNAIICESNNLPTYAIKKIVFDFLNLFTSNQSYYMGDDQCRDLVRCASNPLGCWVAKEQKGLPSFTSLVEAYVQLRNQSFADKKRDDIHYALFLLSEIQHMFDRVLKSAEKEECEAMRAILQSHGLLQQEKTVLRQEEIALYKKFQEVETDELNGRMHYFIQDGDIAKVKESLQIGANPNAICNGHTVLGLAARSSHQEIVKYLVEKGAVIDAKDNAGRTPLMLAAEGGHCPIIEYLVKHGADANSQDNDGCTVLMHAVSEFVEAGKRLEAIKFLIEHCKAYTAIMNNHGQTILKVSAARRAINVVK
jgi:ankyrin repeat protein